MHAGVVIVLMPASRATKTPILTPAVT